MTDRYFQKVGPDILRACNPDAVNYLKKVKEGSMLLAKIKNPRNSKFHRKIFALLNFAYENKEFAPVYHEGQAVLVSFPTFRSNMISWAGFYDVVANIRGDVRCEAHSISYDNCSQEKAEEIYNSLLDVVGKRLFQGGYSQEELEAITEQYLSFI